MASLQPKEVQISIKEKAFGAGDECQMSKLIVLLAIAGLLLLVAFLRPQESKLKRHS